jgi:hypothetical protein
MLRVVSLLCGVSASKRLRIEFSGFDALTFVNENLSN